jgi:hypothetical protein
MRIAPKMRFDPAYTTNPTTDSTRPIPPTPSAVIGCARCFNGVTGAELSLHGRACSVLSAAVAALARTGTQVAPTLPAG